MSEHGSSHAPVDPRSPVEPPLVSGPDDSGRTQAFPAGPLGPEDRTIISRRPAALPGASRPVSPVDLGRMLIGERLNHFELLEYVGGGGMGAVFRATDTMLNREVALKVLSRDQGADDDTRRRFQNEAQSAARLDHENIARVYYVGEDRGLNYIVFEYIEGKNLRDLVQEHGGPLSLADAVSYTLQLAKALEHASSRDVVHRDIKPSNVLITAEGRAKLVDMGLARLHQVDAAGMDLTQSGVTLGTFDYISPEQARDPRSADVRSDMYSLGCTLYFMLTARPPFPEGTVLQKLLQHNSDEPPDAREFNPQVTDDVATVLRKMLAKNPRKRYQNPGELIEDLLVLADQVGLPSTAWGVGLPAAAGSQPAVWMQHLPWIVPIVALLVVVGIIELFSHSSDVDPHTVRSLDPIDRFDLSDRPPPTAPEATPSATPNAAATASSTNAAAMAAGGSATTTVASTATPATLPSPTATDADAAIRPGLLVVGGDTKLPQHYASLRAACSAVKNGEVIELRYNGRREERPINLSNRRFTIRAGEGFEPVVVYRPDESDPLRYPRSMITVVGGKLSLVNLAIELVVPSPSEIPADQWAVLEAQRCESLELQSTSLTVQNASDMGPIHPEVAFVLVRAAPGFDSLMAIDESMPDDPVAISLEDCIARGEATFLRIDDDQTTSLLWDNGLLATSERLLSIYGSGMSPRTEPRVHVGLRHLTMSLGAGFCQMSSTLDLPYLPSVDVDCADSILTAPSTASFVDQHGVDDVATFRQYVNWNGERNFYDGFDPEAMWRIDDENNDSGPTLMTLSDWRAHWGGAHEILATWGEIGWEHGLPSKPVSQQTPADYALADSIPDNMARTGASDGRDAGMRVDTLLRLPTKPNSEK